MRISIRSLIKELLENENLIVSYNELNDGGFDLSVRINEEEINTPEKINKIMDEHIAELKKDKTDSIVYVPVKDGPKQSCPHCGSENTKYLYGIAALSEIGKAQISEAHLICQDCMAEFNVDYKEIEAKEKFNSLKDEIEEQNNECLDCAEAFRYGVPCPDMGGECYYKKRGK